MARVTQEQFGERLAALRKRAGYTQRRAAEELGVSNETLSRLERGQQWTDFDTLVGLARIYEVGLSQLMRLAEDNGNPRQRVLQALNDLLATAPLEQLILLRDLAETLLKSTIWDREASAKPKRYR